MAWTDGVKDVWDGLLKSNVVISSAFDNIKNVFNEILLFIYELYFFIVIMLFVVISIGMFIVLPIYLIRVVKKNQTEILKILKFDF